MALTQMVSCRLASRWWFYSGVDSVEEMRPAVDGL